VPDIRREQLGIEHQSGGGDQEVHRVDAGMASTLPTGQEPGDTRPPARQTGTQASAEKNASRPSVSWFAHAGKELEPRKLARDQLFP